MKASMRRWLACVAALAGMAGVPHVASADGPPISAEAARALANIESDRGKRSAEDRRAAERLTAEGDRAYRKQDYDAAYRAYFNAYPNFPTAYAYLLAGDARWRSAVQFQERRAGQPAPDGSTCLEANHRFARELTMDVANHYEVGLALAQRDSAFRRKHPDLAGRARASASCLQAVAAQAETAAPRSCVDIPRLRACLGEPLLK
jgi:hypothetical protein